MLNAKNSAKKGENHGRAKLTDHEVELIRCMAAEGVPQKVLAEKFEICKAHVSQLIHFLRR